MMILGLSCTAVSAPEGEKKSRPPFNVGFRVIDLQYQQDGVEKTLTVAVWYPTATQPKTHDYGGSTRGMVAVDAPPLADGGPYPLLVFSHGYGGSGLSSVFLTERLAARGWIVAAPDHHDSHSAVRIRSGRVRDLDRQGLMHDTRQITLSGPGDRGRYLYRLDELQLVIDRMVGSGSFGGLIDRGRIAVGGHSFGGFTALGLCGTVKERLDPRIRAVLLFSTGAGGYLFSEEELARVKIPSMSFMGEREKGQRRGNRTMSQLAAKIYRNLPPPKYFLEIRGANHFSFNNALADSTAARFLNGTPEQFEVIGRYSIAFLEKYVAGREEPGHPLEQEDPLLSGYLRE
ncbi:MAG TPA: hypothetical protein VMJ66_01970 [Geobacteraceae bacterium]|nr:hypothetical protein [Geobacteraceae bacterium]